MLDDVLVELSRRRDVGASDRRMASGSGSIHRERVLTRDRGRNGMPVRGECGTQTSTSTNGVCK